MTDTTVDEMEMDLLDDLSDFENSFDRYFRNYDPTLIDDDFPEDLVLDISILSEESKPSVNPIVSSSHDIPTNPKEWMVTDHKTGRQKPPRLFEFLNLLLQKPHYACYASYKDKSLGIFEIHDPEKVADLWQQVKNRQSIQKMTYDKFARAIRWYYQDGIMKKTNARYTFQFSSKTLKAFRIDENNNALTN